MHCWNEAKNSSSVVRVPEYGGGGGGNPDGYFGIGLEKHDLCAVDV
jgi:hypothetical protein